MGCLLLGATVLITLFGWLAFQSPLWSNTENARYSVNLMDIVSVFMMIMYVVMLIGVVYGTYIYLSLHFYKTMYTDQGYLLHTLPVTKHEILGTKILVSGVWVLLTMIAITLSVILFVVACFTSVFRADGYTMASAWQEIRSYLLDLPAWFNIEFGWDMTGTLVFWGIGILVSPFVTMTILFGAISLGQLFTKYRVVMAIVCYIGISIIRSLIESVSQWLMIPLQNSGVGNYVNFHTVFSLAVTLLMAVVLYFISWMVTSRKLNMQ